MWALLRGDPALADPGAAASGGQRSAEDIVRELARLSPLDDDRRREAEAKALGVRLSTLDRLVAQARGAEAGQAGAEAPRFADDAEAPWATPVDGA
jgi:hypothetical protein